MDAFLHGFRDELVKTGGGLAAAGALVVPAMAIGLATGLAMQDARQGARAGAGAAAGGALGTALAAGPIVHELEFAGQQKALKSIGNQLSSLPTSVMGAVMQMAKKLLGQSSTKTLLGDLATGQRSGLGRLNAGAAIGLPLAGLGAGAYFAARGHEKEAQIKRQVTFDGLTIKLEYDAGDTRTGKNKKTGKAWSKEMKAGYGYVPNTKGVDGDGIDIYLAKKPVAGSDVYVVHQVKDDGSHDEDKAVVGCSSAAEAKALYLAHTPAKYFGSMKAQSMASFRHFCQVHHRKGVTA